MLFKLTISSNLNREGERGRDLEKKSSYRESTNNHHTCENIKMWNKSDDDDIKKRWYHDKRESV